MKRRVSKWPIVLALVTFVILFSFIVSIFIKRIELSSYNKVDFGFIDAASDGCKLIGPNGRSIQAELLNAAPGASVTIPQGTIIVGDCFVIKSEAQAQRLEMSRGKYPKSNDALNERED
ncbi:hypothetical protein [Pseudomonas sp. R9.37]|uniref:hypothetical protein n=1 Tax=Pseudomonas sp. R9.37 TaxID=1390498 RepID=UPI000D0CE605|nr:hypothetical protein [Pseudomonas sp. R9.37]PSL90755.1 hypothetical protein C7U57_28460 [Pseudomonas sp. R9.37]